MSIATLLHQHLAALCVCGAHVDECGGAGDQNIVILMLLVAAVICVCHCEVITIHSLKGLADNDIINSVAYIHRCLYVLSCYAESLRIMRV